MSIVYFKHRESPKYELPGVLTLALKSFEVFNTQYKMADFNFDDESVSLPVVENCDMPEVAGGGQVDYLIELFQGPRTTVLSEVRCTT